MPKKLIALLFAAVLLSGCNLFSSLLKDGEVVAKVGKHKLFLSEIEQYLPSGLSPSDSAAFAISYIDSWVTDRLFLLEAERQLSKAEFDVSEELEDYRLALVKYRYEKRYLNDRLDTLVSPGQIEQYYQAHLSDFTLRTPVVKVRFLDVMADSPAKEEMVSLLSSNDYSDLEVLDSLAARHALRYFDHADTWMSADDLAHEFGLSTAATLSMMRGSIITFERPDRGDVLVANVCEILRSGTAPLEYCTPAIRDIIISSRKQELLAGLEQDLLDSARENHKIEIYQR